MKKYLVLGFVALLGGCLGIPQGVTPVRDFELDKYLGTWYEIARLDHFFERGLTRVTAKYSLREDGGVQVLNRGFSAEDDRWKEAEGKAYFVRETDEGYLKVSFFGPFYSSYVIFELDQEDYQYAFVSGKDPSYLWLLSRSPEVSEEVWERFLARVRELGVNPDALIRVEQEPQPAE